MKKSKKIFYKRKRSIVKINVVPYIDVMLILLIIFMITTPIIMQGVKVDLPKTHSEKIASNKSNPIVITINKNGQYFVNQSISNSKIPLNSDDLANTLVNMYQKDNRNQIYVRGDSNAKYGEVLKAMALIQKIGIDKVGLVTEDEKS